MILTLDLLQLFNWVCCTSFDYFGPIVATIPFETSLHSSKCIADSTDGLDQSPRDQGVADKADRQGCIDTSKSTPELLPTTSKWYMSQHLQEKGLAHGHMDPRKLRLHEDKACGKAYQKRSLASSFAASCFAVVISRRAVTAWTVSLAVCLCHAHTISKLLCRNIKLSAVTGLRAKARYLLGVFRTQSCYLLAGVFRQGLAGLLELAAIQIFLE